MPGMYEADVVGKIQEIGDVIFNAESHQTPISRLLKRGKKPAQMLCEWESEKYPNRGFGGTLDGKDQTTFNHTKPEKLSGYAMLLRTEGWLVTRLAQLTKAAGVKNQQAKQAADDGLILAKMCEKQICANLDTRAEAGVNPYRSRGMYSWLQNAAQGVLPVPANFRPAAACWYTGAIASFLPTNMITMLNAMATAKNGILDLTMPCGLTLKGQMSTWPQLSTGDTDIMASTTNWNIDATDKKLVAAVDEFEFDAGTVKTVPDFFLACNEADGEPTAYSPRSGLCLELSMWELCELMAPSTFEGVDAGGGPRGWHEMVFILKGLNPLGQGGVLSNS